MVALLLAAALSSSPSATLSSSPSATLSSSPSARPWVDVSAGPLFLHRSGRAGLDSGPLVRLHLGMPLGERFAAELWASGALQSAPLGTPGDSAIASGGAVGISVMPSLRCSL
jgi:hypothetical protein